jgi:hypothetical protein
MLEANPTIESYAKSNLVRFENKIMFYHSEKCSSLLQRCR